MDSDPRSDDGLVTCARQGPVAVLSLARPGARNALCRALVDQLSAHLEQVSHDPDIRIVLLRHEGPSFCAGMDLKEAAQESASTLEAEALAVRDMEGYAELLGRLHRMPQPTIAVMEGDALGGGAGLALTCDFLFMSRSARLGFPEVRRGLVPAVVLQDVIRQVGDRRARELLLTGRPIDADTADRWGLVTRVVEPGTALAKAHEFAADLLQAAPTALETTKRLIDEAECRLQNLRGAAAVSASVRISEEAAEGLRAFLGQRPPRWNSSIEPPTA